MRGNHCQAVIRRCVQGSIPAHAGQPFPEAATESIRQVYPRACGATINAARNMRAGWGLSPRMRGNQANRQGWTRLKRSIPAHAGQPPKRKPEVVYIPVYPRACGATQRHPWHALLVQGLSPRMRGNLLNRRSRQWSRRSIPAHAGQPAVSIRYGAPRAVYPRACGATDSTATHI